jgi:hypothetical protein
MAQFALEEPQPIVETVEEEAQTTEEPLAKEEEPQPVLGWE